MSAPPATKLDGKGAVGAAAYPPLAADKNLAPTEFMLDVLFAD